MTIALKSSNSTATSVTTSTSSVAIPLPGTIAVGDPLLVAIATGATASVFVPTTPPGWSVILPATTTNTASGYVIERTGGWQTADGSSLTLTVSTPASAYDLVAVSACVDGTISSDFGASGTVSNRGGTSSSTIACAAAGSTGQSILAIALEKASTHPSNPTVSVGSLLAFTAKSGSSTPSVAIAGYDATAGTSTLTFTYPTASGNGIGFQLPLTPASGSVTGAADMVSTSSLGAAGSNAAASAAMVSTSGLGAAATTPSGVPQAGGVTDSGSRVMFYTRAVSSARVVYSTHSDLSSPSYTASVSPDSDGVVDVSLSGLSAGTGYWYAIEADGTLLPSSIGRLRTMPAAGSQADFTVRVGSCQFTDSNHAIFSRMASQSATYDLLGLWHLGDLHYRDWATNGITAAATIKAQQKSSTGQPNMAALLAVAPWVYTWDNHDWGGAHSDATNPAGATLQAMYRQMVPSYPLAADSDDQSGAIDHTFSIGRVSFFVLDTRSQRSAYTDPDNSSKTMLGAGQKARLKAWMADPTSPVKCIVSGIPFKNYGGVGGDRWGDYLTEFTEIAGYWTASGKGHLFAVGGDIHALAMDDGSHEAYASIPNFVSSPMDQSGTSSGGSSWSQGIYPPSGTNTNHFFVDLDIHDTGTQITVTGTGYDDAGVARMQMPLTFTVSQPGTAAMVSTSSLGAAATRSTPATAGMVSTSSLAAAGTRSTPATAGMVSTSSLGAATPVVSSAQTAAMTSTSALTAAGTTGITAAMTSTSALAGDATRSTPAQAGMTSTSALTGGATRSSPAAAAMVSTSTLATANPATSATAGMVSTSSLSAAVAGDTVLPAPPERTYTVPAEHRIYHVTSGDHAYARS